MRNYTVKTRNWNQSKIAYWLLKLWSYPADDKDIKCYIVTSNPFKAWALWLYFMAIRPLSGGWTYIQHN